MHSIQLLQVCVDAMMANSVTDRRIMRRLTNVVAACGFEVVSFKSFDFAETGDDGYMLTVWTGAPTFCAARATSARTPLRL